MTDRFKHFLEGIGSIVDICPDTNRYAHLVPRKSQDERMKQAWDATGKQIKNAISQLSNEQEQKKRSVR